MGIKFSNLAIVKSALLVSCFMFGLTANADNSEYKAAMDRAESAYDLAKDNCDKLSGNAEDVCEKQAKADRKQAEADAKAQYKSSSDGVGAQEDARDAHYEAAKEKCDYLSGDAKDACISQAKVKHNQ